MLEVRCSKIGGIVRARWEWGRGWMMEVSRMETLKERSLRWLTGDETRFGGGEPSRNKQLGPVSQSAISNGSFSDARATRRHLALQGTPSLQKLRLCFLFHQLRLQRLQLDSSLTPIQAELCRALSTKAWVSVALFMMLSDLTGLALRNTGCQRVAVHRDDFTGT